MYVLAWVFALFLWHWLPPSLGAYRIEETMDLDFSRTVFLKHMHMQMALRRHIAMHPFTFIVQVQLQIKHAILVTIQ